MRKKLLFTLLIACFWPLIVLADFNPTAYYTIDGEEMESTDMIADAQAPLTVRFAANPTETEGDVGYEWRFTREGEEKPFMTRYEETTTYEFKQSGMTKVELYVTMAGYDEAELTATFSISITNSMLEMPNAFSPNGDGINDVYKAKKGWQSITEFHAYIFNRWGQKLYEWSDPDGGWDGTYKGKEVKQGVYFCLVKAKGADGRNYNIKTDVNLLRGYTESSGAGATE